MTLDSPLKRDYLLNKLTQLINMIYQTDISEKTISNTHNIGKWTRNVFEKTQWRLCAQLHARAEHGGVGVREKVL